MTPLVFSCLRLWLRFQENESEASSQGLWDLDDAGVYARICLTAFFGMFHLLTDAEVGFI
jgi:hypothetical protein